MSRLVRQHTHVKMPCLGRRTVVVQTQLCTTTMRVVLVIGRVVHCKITPSLLFIHRKFSNSFTLCSLKKPRNLTASNCDQYRQSYVCLKFLVYWREPLVFKNVAAELG